MDKTKDFDELQELKVQFNLISEKLEKQAIINESLIKESMKRKISYVERFYKWYFAALVVVIPLFTAILLCKNAHWGFVVFALAALLVESMLYFRGYRTLNSKELMVMGFVDAMERVSLFKKRFSLVTKIMMIPSLIIFVMFIGLFTNYTFDVGYVIYYGLFILAALILEYTRKKKMFAKLDTLLEQIKELRKV